jgi:hypothetical protein
MIISPIVIDDFYVEPHRVREMALNEDFSVSGNYPGLRTGPFLSDSIFNIIQSIIKVAGGKILNWSDFDYTGAFQYTTSRDRSWIHADEATMWAGVCYLTPNAPLSAGTGLFRHKETGLESAPKKIDGSYNEELMNLIYRDSQDMTKWELTDRVANKFNRLVLYRGDLFHMSLDYFGQDKYDGRLFQTFFFNSEY